MKTTTFYIVLVLLTSCHSKRNNNKLSTVASLPVFKMVSLDSSQFINTANLAIGNTSLFIYFSPDCEDCHQETIELLKHQYELRNTNIYMITNESVESTRKFYETFRLDTVKNIFVGRDYEYSFYKTYKPLKIPLLAIYDRENKLKKIYKGQTSINFIIKTIRESN